MPAEARQAWTIVYELPREDGKRRQKSQSGFKTKEDAEKALIAKLHSIERGTFVESTNVATDDYLSGWLDGLETEGLRPTTIRSYRLMVETCLLPKLRSVPLQRLTSAHLNAAYAELLRSGRKNGESLSPRSVRYCHTILSRALKDAVDAGLLVRNVGQKAKPPRGKSAGEMRTWSADELRTFLATSGTTASIRLSCWPRPRVCAAAR